MVNKIMDMGLMNELLEYNPIQFKTEKAARVYMKCLIADKIKLAQKIQDKWAIPKRYDIVEAFKYSLMVSNLK